MRTVKVRILPPQPIFFDREFGRTPLVSGDRQARFQPALPPAVHRFDVVVAHLLQILRHECGAKSTAAIQDELCIRVRDSLLDVALDDAPAPVNGAGKMPLTHSLSSRTSTSRNFSPASLRRFTSATLVSLIFFFASLTSFRNCAAWGIGKLLPEMDWR